MHTVAEVLGLIAETIRVMPEETVELAESCGRVLSRGVVMDMDAPPFDRAMRDGYAVGPGDGVAGARLEIIGMQDAGMECGVEVMPGKCVGINTGAVMPKGAVGVVMVEDTKLKVKGEKVKLGGGMVEIVKGLAKGETNVQQRGSDARVGEQVLAKGTPMTPAGMAVAAAAGAAQVWVHKKVRVAVLTTGDEVVGVAERPGAAQIRNTNGPMLGALVREAGAELVELGVALDVKEEIAGRVRRGLAEADVLVVTGGVSMGTKDLVPEVLVEAGVRVVVETVKMKPGKPLLFGVVEGRGVRGEGLDGKKWVFGLPGNPVSGFVCGVRFVLPALRAMMGGAFAAGVEHAMTDGKLEANGGREFYQPGVTYGVETLRCVTPLAWRGSADVFTLAKANVLIVQAAGAKRSVVGDMVEVLRIGG